MVPLASRGWRLGILLSAPQYLGTPHHVRASGVLRATAAASDAVTTGDWCPLPKTVNEEQRHVVM